MQAITKKSTISSIPRSARLELEKLRPKIEKKIHQLEQKDTSYQFPEFKQVVQNAAIKAAKVVNMKPDDIMDFLLQFVALEMANKKGLALDEYKRFNYRSNALRALVEIGSSNAVETFKSVFHTLRASSVYFDQILSWPDTYWYQLSDQNAAEVLEFVIKTEMQEAVFWDAASEFNCVPLLYYLGMVDLLKNRTSTAMKRLGELSDKTGESEVDIHLLKLIKLYMSPPSRKLLENQICTECNISLSYSTEITEEVPRHLESLTHFPHELLVLIVSFLGVRDLISLSETCKEWNKIANSEWIWESLCWRDFIAKESIEEYKQLLTEVNLMDGKLLYFVADANFGQKQFKVLATLEEGLDMALSCSFKYEYFVPLLGEVQERLLDKYMLVIGHFQIHLTKYDTVCKGFYKLVVTIYQTAHSTALKSNLRSLLEKGVTHIKHASSLHEVLAQFETSKATLELVSFFALCYVQHKCASSHILSYIMKHRGKELVEKMVKEKLIPKALFIKTLAAHTADLLIKEEISSEYLQELVYQFGQTEDGLHELTTNLAKDQRVLESIL